jgi:hypothetical protein
MHKILVIEEAQHKYMMNSVVPLVGIEDVEAAMKCYQECRNIDKEIIRSAVIHIIEDARGC